MFNFWTYRILAPRIYSFDYNKMWQSLLHLNMSVKRPIETVIENFKIHTYESLDY